MKTILKYKILNKNIASVFAFAAIFMASSQAHSMSLNDALAAAYKNNPELKAQQADLRALDEQYPQALAGFLPTADIRYSKGFDKQSVNARRYEKSNPENRSFNVTQPLFNGGGTVAAVQIAKYRILAGRNNLRSSEQRILNTAVAAYSDVVRTREVLRLSRNNEKVLAEQFKSTNERFDLGETTRTDVAQSESRLARAKSDRINAEGQAIEAESAFQRIFVIAPPADMKLPAALPVPPKTFKEALDAGIKNNPSLVAAKYTKEASDKGIWRQVAELLPSADLTASWIKEDSLNSFRGGSVDEKALTMNVRVPLFQSGAEYARVRAARSDAEGSADRVDDAYNRVVDSVTAAWQQIITANATVESRQKTVEAATVALDGVRQEREIGSRTTLDVLDAEQELFTANVDLVTAKRNRVVAVYNLLEAMGSLTAQQTGLNVDYYDAEKHYDKVKYKIIGF